MITDSLKQTVVHVQLNAIECRECARSLNVIHSVDILLCVCDFFIAAARFNFTDDFNESLINCLGRVLQLCLASCDEQVGNTRPVVSSFLTSCRQCIGMCMPINVASKATICTHTLKKCCRECLLESCIASDDRLTFATSLGVRALFALCSSAPEVITPCLLSCCSALCKKTIQAGTATMRMSALQQLLEGHTPHSMHASTNYSSKLHKKVVILSPRKEPFADDHFSQQSAATRLLLKFLDQRRV